MTSCITYLLPLPICRHHFLFGLSPFLHLSLPSFTTTLVDQVSVCSTQQICVCDCVCVTACVCVCETACVGTCILSGVNAVMHVWCSCINTWAFSQTVATKKWIHEHLCSWQGSHALTWRSRGKQGYMSTKMQFWSWQVRRMSGSEHGLVFASAHSRRM